MIIGHLLRRYFYFCAVPLFIGAGSVSADTPSTLDLNALKPVETINLGNGVTMEFILIKPGSFTMGSDKQDIDERPVRKIAITVPFYIGKYEVTQEQWSRVMGNNPSHFQGDRLPVDNLCWNDCQQFVAALQKKTGRHFSLPTEAQWEYACRAGTTTEFNFGDDTARLDDYAWYSGNAEQKTHPVGKKKSNDWGLYDMHGNVYEWCADWYSEGPYPKGDLVDPRGPRAGHRRVLRGGGWIYVAENLCSADRGFSPPDSRLSEYGMRCVLLLDDPKTPEAVINQSPATIDPLPPIVERLQALIDDGDRLAAEFALTQNAQQINDPKRLAELRATIAKLPSPDEQIKIDIASDIPMEFVLIRPGTFIMGSDESPLDNEQPNHRVNISRPFYLGKYEVTQAQWSALMERNPSATANSESDTASSGLPVDNLSWVLCQSFLSKLNEKIPGREFRLPTEAEWEYACRAGAGNSQISDKELIDYGWYGANAGNRTHPVGQKKANAWGLFDMYGNVWEWCQDRFGPYSAEPAVDPVGPLVSDAAAGRVLRGGAWNNIATHVTATFRHDASPTIPLRYYGFRCVMELPKPIKKP